VAGCLLQLPDGIPIVVDPVLVATSGARLLAPGALDALVGLIVPLAAVVTPNLPEARALVGAAEDDGDAADLARSLHGLGPGAVVVTGGHRAGEAVDVFFDGREVTELAGPRHPGGATHGSGCTHSAALAAHLALGASPLEAARQARAIAAEAIGHGLDGIGGGEGPVDALGAWRENAHPTPGRLP
jgi:hydroxymethylpyrimidine/phosphomethylpyrimidine kinase